MNYWVRLFLLMIFDAFLVNASIYISLLLRFEGQIMPEYLEAFFYLVPWYTVITLVCLYAFRLYHRMWQYASLGELSAIVKAVTISTAGVVGCIYLFGLPTLPRSVYLLGWFFIIAFTGGSRLAWRMIRDSLLKDISTVARPTLIVGAGDAGAMVAREILNNHSLNLYPVGFVDDSSLKQHLTIYDIPVLGNRKSIPRLVHKYGIEEIIIAMPSAPGRTIKEIMDICRETPAKVRIFQGSSEMLGDTTYRIRDIQVEDLLRREPVKMNLDEVAHYLEGKTVLVSGAGGSIGSELCRQIAVFKPRRLILLEYSENNLFDIYNELRELFADLEIIPDLTDIKDRMKLQQTFNRYEPQVVFHAAAYKHVPMMELHPAEAIKNNVLGTKNMAEIAHRSKVETFILISTDKAVNPSSVMGATKRIAEMIIQEMNQNSSTIFAAVRFGNVLGSRGSVIPTFKKQIEQGGPVTVTHPAMTRYFMTIPEAVQLVIEAGAMARGGEIFVLDMGEPVKIIDLAQDLIRLYGKEPDKDIEIQITGIRPGEKLQEELFSSLEQMAATQHDRIYISRQEEIAGSSIITLVDRYFSKNAFINQAEIIELIATLIPDFTHQSVNRSI